MDWKSTISFFIYSGQGVRQDYTQAMQWSEQGNASAQFNIGHVHYNGQGVRKDKEIVKECFLNLQKTG